MESPTPQSQKVVVILSCLTFVGHLLMLWKDTASSPIVFAPVMRGNSGDCHAFCLGSVYKFIPAQIDTYMARIARGLEENEISRLELISFYRIAFSDLFLRSPRQVNIENPFIDCPDEARTICSRSICSTHSVLRGFPPRVFIPKTFFCCTRIGTAWGHSRRFEMKGVSRSQFRLSGTRHLQQEYGQHYSQLKIDQRLEPSIHFDRRSHKSLSTTIDS